MASTLKLYLCRNINHRMSCALARLVLSMYFKYLTVSGLSATHMVLHTSINEISWFPTQSQLSHSFSIVHLESLHFALNNFLLANDCKGVDVFMIISLQLLRAFLTLSLVNTISWEQHQISGSIMLLKETQANHLCCVFMGSLR